MSAPEDTIAAIGTAAGTAGISIVRVSGPEALSLADAIFRCSGVPPSKRPGGSFVYGYTHGEDDDDVDEVLLLVMRGPNSFTREDMFEIQGHGGNASARRNLRLVLQAGARLAEPGEFTKRAFLNGRLDLLQAEAVLDLIQASSDRAACAALEQLEGKMSASFNNIYDRLLSIAADLEATLDFPEDELPSYVLEQIIQALKEVGSDTEALIATWDEGHLLREGARAVIAGQPNVGKSTMLNALLGHDRAIVSPVPGTTRDTIEEGFVLDGIPLRLVDTAGLRDATDGIEQEGIRRTRRHLEEADLYIYIVDASQPLSDDDRNQLASLDPARSLVVLNKTDLGQVVGRNELDASNLVAISLLQPEGIETVLSALSQLLQSGHRLAAKPSAVISERHRKILEDLERELEEALKLLSGGDEADVPLAASRLRAGVERLGTATGRHYQEELLDAIFSRFCIGK